MSGVHGEGNVVYSYVCLTYRVREILCTVCVCVCEVQVEGKAVYSDVCSSYRMREMLCTVLCV